MQYPKRLCGIGTARRLRKIALPHLYRRVIFTACEGNEWVDWTEFEICTVELKAGQTNTIVLENHAPNPSVDGCAPSGNFDYFELIPVDQSAVLTQVNAVTPV